MLAGDIDQGVAAVLSDAFDLRVRADYDPLASLSPARVRALTPEVERFVGACAAVVEAALGQGADDADPEPDV